MHTFSVVQFPNDEHWYVAHYVDGHFVSLMSLHDTEDEAKNALSNHTEVMNAYVKRGYR